VAALVEEYEKQFPGAALISRYNEQIEGILSCYDRIVITGTLPHACYAGGMTAFLYTHGIRIFDYPKWAEPLRDAIRSRAEELASAAGIKIEHVNKAHVRKEDIVAKILEQRGEQPGLVHVISAMEACQSYKPWHDKGTGKTFLKPDTGKCLHYYFYFIDPQVGLCYLRVPTWCPFKLQFYCNGHGWLARQLKARGIGFTQADNAFVHIDDWPRRSGWPMASSPSSCTGCWISMHGNAARCKRPSASAITGASCRWSTPLTWCFARQSSSSLSMSSFPARRCSR
jgi:hypothetical protein